MALWQEPKKPSRVEGSCMKRAVVPHLGDFDELPNSAMVRVPLVAAHFSISPSTVWRWSSIGRLPPPIRVGGVALWNVGELRKWVTTALADGDGEPRSS